jgi:hypothetical protein
MHIFRLQKGLKKGEAIYFNSALLTQNAFRYYVMSLGYMLHALVAFN